MNAQRLEKYKELLIVVDMVKGFVTEGALADPSVSHIIKEQVRLVEDFLKRGEGVLFVKDAHTKDSKEFDSFPPHCIKGTREAELVDELMPYEKHGLVVEKNSTSAIFAPHFLENMEAMKNVKTVVGVGVEQDICVPNLFIPLKNYFNEYNRSVEIIIPENATETYNAPWHERDAYKEASNLLMKQAGIQLVKKYR